MQPFDEEAVILSGQELMTVALSVVGGIFTWPHLDGVGEGT